MGCKRRAAWFGRGICFVQFAAAMLAPAPAAAQFGFSSEFALSGSVQVREPDGEARSHLERVKALLADEQWDETVETLRQLMEMQGDRLIALEPDRYLTLRDYCHLQIAQLPPAALQLYRDRVDPLARRWYEQGVAERDAALLSRVVNQFFCSRWGDDALLKLAELELEQGHFGAARAHLTRISPLLRTPTGKPLWLVLRRKNLDEIWPQLEPLLKEREARPLWLAYPDTDLELADVRARLVLVSILEGARSRAQFDLELLRRLHPEARGQWAGREVNYAEELTRMLTASRDWLALPPVRQWTTFAGSAARTASTAPAARPGGPAWEAPIGLWPAIASDASMAESLGHGASRPAEDPHWLLPYHPLVVDDLLLVNNLSEIKAFDLQTGKPAWGQEEGVFFRDGRPAFSTSRTSRSRLGVPRFTMTAADGKLFARMGEPVTSWPPEPPQTMQSGYLVCLDLQAQGQLLWKADAGGDPSEPQAGGALWAFEGSPVVADGRVYIGMRRSDVRPQAYLACFDAQTGRRIWRQFVCAAETPARGQVDEITTNLLTLAEGTLYYNTNLGAVASLSPEDGHLNWLSLYPRDTARGDLSNPASHFYRDLNPCVYYRGLLLVAPTDCAASHQIFALDAATGQELWASKHPTDAIHLLGVSGDHLIASGNRLWWLNVYSGNAVRTFPESELVGALGFGRGTLAGGEIFFPTRDRIYVFDAKTTQQTQEPIHLARLQTTSGNLLAIDDYLLIASGELLYGFRPPPRREPPPQPSVTAIERLSR